MTPEDYEQQLEALEKSLSRSKARHVNTAGEISRVRAVVTTWFETLRPLVALRGIRKENLEAIDAVLKECVELTVQRSFRRRYRTLIRKASQVFKRQIVLALTTQTNPSLMDAAAQAVAQKLAQLSPALAASYRQIYLDLADTGRLSYRGTANELREILREVLERLAPEQEILAQSWYQPVEGRQEPTRQQRARYILERRGAGSKAGEVATQTLTTVDKGLAKLVSDMYSRAAAAAHTSQDIAEIRRILGYFNPLIHDLCG